MSSNGNGGPSDGRKVEGKGKGRAEDDNRDDGQQGRSSGLLQSVMESARSSVNPQALQSILASGGKGGSGGMVTAGNISMQKIDDLNGVGRGASSIQQSSFPPRNSIRSIPSQSENNNAFTQFATNGEEQFLVDRFGRDMQIEDASSSSFTAGSNPALVGPFNSASALDRPMHDFVRSAITQQQPQQSNDLLDAWENAQMKDAYPDTVYDPNYHDAWARNIPAPMFPAYSQDRGEAFHNLQQTIIEPTTTNSHAELDFMDTLANEEMREQEAERIVKPAPPILDTNWRPPTPSERPSLTQEQYDMHSKLAEKQDGQTGQSADERIKPPDDDEEARTGIYAPTPEDALLSIWDGEREGERASQNIRTIHQTRTSDAANVIRKVRRLLKRGSYSDDVYGLPPALVATISQAEEPENDLNKDLRAKAIARLGALYQHLEGPNQPSNDEVNKFVKDW